MLRNMLDSITGMEQSFQLQTFSSLRAANQWLLLQDRITVTAFEVQGVATVGIGKFLPRRVLIAYQTEEEPNDFFYGISSGLEYIYDGDDLTHSIETNWKHQNPKLELEQIQEVMVHGIRTYHRKYYALYRAPHASDGCRDTVLRVRNVFSDENYFDNSSLRYYSQVLAAELLIAVVCTLLWLLGIQGGCGISQTGMRIFGVLVYTVDTLLGINWVFLTRQRFRSRKRR